MTPATAGAGSSPDQLLAGAVAALSAGCSTSGLARLAGLRRTYPHWAEPVLRQAEFHRAAGDVAAAQTLYRQALVCDPDRHEALLALGAMHVASGEGDAAAPLLQRCAGARPQDAKARHALGLARQLQGRLADAYADFVAAHRLDLANALCSLHLAEAAQKAGEAPVWLAVFEREAQADPWNVASLTGYAILLAHAHRRPEALDALQAATLLQPDAPVPAALYADMLARTTRPAEAEPALRRALELDPANADATMALSVVLMRLHRHRDALALLEDLLARGADPVGPLCNMTTVLVCLGRQDEAVERARAAIALAPDHPAPRRALCNALPYQAGVTGAALLAAARDCAERQPHPSLPALANLPDPSRRLRIGLLSGTLRTHPVGWLTVAGFEHLDPAAFHITCLTPEAPHDSFGHRFAAVAEAWELTDGHDDAALAAHIRSLGIDVLIDLGGYGDLGRMQVCAHRAAPVQIKWVGMQNHSTGLADMDWFITDRWETPKPLATLYSERLLTLCDGYVCYAPPDDAPPVAPPPSVTRGSFSYGCNNNLAKITPAVVALWSRILAATDGTRMVLKTHQFNDATIRAGLHAAFAGHGIDPARIVLRGSSPHREVLRQYEDVDLVLDPFPYSGGLTTLEALWMGVPTLTMPGDNFASRHSTSHLSNAGLHDFVVADADAYVAAAIAHAADPSRLAALRPVLRERMRAGPLCDGPRFGRSLGAALRHAWTDWCRTQACPDVNRSL